MGEFLRCIEPILREEGGLSNLPDDPGGLTHYGISQRSYPHLNIAELTRDDAKALYQRDYWLPIGGALLPVGLDLMMLDCAIHQGASTAIRLLQQALRIRDDGLLGPETLSAAKAAMPTLLESYAAERALRYEFNPNELRFGRGRRNWRPGCQRRIWAMPMPICRWPMKWKNAIRTTPASSAPASGRYSACPGWWKAPAMTPPM